MAVWGAPRGRYGSQRDRCPLNASGRLCKRHAGAARPGSQRQKGAQLRGYHTATLPRVLPPGKSADCLALMFVLANACVRGQVVTSQADGKQHPLY